MKQSSSSRKPRPRNNSRKPSRGSGQSGGNRVENRVRGNPKQLLDKYKTQARDARQAGDRILAENYYQFADHYQRILNEMRLGCGGVFEEYREVPKRPQPEQQDFADDDSFEAGDEQAADGDVAEGETAQADLDAGDQSQENRGSRSARAARAEAEEQRGRDNRRGQRGRRRRPADSNQTGFGDDQPGFMSAGVTQSDEASEPADDNPVAVSSDDQAAETPRPRARARRKPRAPEAGGEATLSLDEPETAPQTEPETDAA